MLYLNVDGLTNMAIAEGTLCRFTRVVGGGIEAMASQLAERRSIPLVEARALIAAVDLTLQPAPAPEPIAQSVVAETEAELEPEDHGAVDPEAPTAIVDEVAPADVVASVEDQDARERDMSYAEMAGVGQPAAEVPEPDVEPPTDAPPAPAFVPAPVLSSQTPDADVRTVLENGIREIAGEVRNSLDFHRSQEGGGEVERVVLSGAALDLPGFAEALQEQLGIQVERESVHSDEQQLGGSPRIASRSPPVSPSRRHRDEGLQPDPRRRARRGRRQRRQVGWQRVRRARPARVLAILALLYGQASRQISSQTGKIATLNAQAQGAQAQAAKLAPYVSFKTMHEQRVQAVDQLVDSRFDWAHAFHELGRVLPPGQVSLSSLSGTIGGSSGGSTSAGVDTAAGASSKAAAATGATTPTRVARALRQRRARASPRRRRPAASRRSRSPAARRASRWSR